MHRRNYLRVLSASFPVALSGCLTGDDEQDDPTTADTSVETTVEDTATSTATSEEETRTETLPETTQNQTTQQTTESTDTGSSEPADYTIRVGPDGEQRYEPSSLTISSGDTVAWVWESDTHNVRPSNGTWSGTDGDDNTWYDEGYRFTYTFDVPDTYDYYCGRHTQMTGTVIVKDN